MIKRSRVTLPDTIKGIAVLLMIQVHLMELFALDSIYHSNFGLLSLFLGGIPAAPVFMVIMGYFVAFANKSSYDMFKRGLILFIGGIALNIGLNLHLLYNIFILNWDYNPWHFIFGVDILPLAGLSLLSLALFKKIASNKYWVYFIIAAVIAAISYFFEPLQFEEHSLPYIFAFLVGGTTWAYFPLVPWLAYPVLGYGFKLMVDQINLAAFVNTKSAKIIVAVLSLSLLLTAKFGISISTHLTVYYHHNLLFFVWAVAFMIVWTYALYLLNKVAENSPLFYYLQFVGRNVTIIYILQWLIIGNIGTSIYRTQGFIALGFWFVMITTIVSILAYMWTKIRAKSSENH